MARRHVHDFVSGASTLIPGWLDHSAWHEHGPFGFWLVEAHRPRILVELGTHTGFSFLTFCQAISRFDIPARAYAIDTWRGDEHSGFYGEEVFQSLNAYHSAYYAGFSTLVRSAFADALPHFQDGSIDLLHIDGRHRYEDVREDFVEWAPKLSDRAVVLIHDTNVRERGFGVARFWSEVKRDFPHFEFFHGHGLGVLGVGKNLPAAITALLEVRSDGDRATEIRGIYARLGSNLTDRLAKKDAETALRSVSARTTAIETELKARDAEMASLQRSLAAADQRITTAMADIERLAGELAASKAEIAILEIRRIDEIRTLSGALREREVEVEAYKLSRIWRVTKPYRQLRSALRKQSLRLRHAPDRAWSRIRRHINPSTPSSPVGALAKRLAAALRVVSARFAPHIDRLNAGREQSGPSDAAQGPLRISNVRGGRTEDRLRLTRDDCFRRVVYVSGAPDIPSHRYRVTHQVESLNEAGISAGWVSIADVAAFEISLVFAEIVVLFRVALDPVLSTVIEKCRRAGSLILFDIDDYVFDPQIANAVHVDGIRFLPPDEVDLYRKGVLGYRAALQEADGGLVTTQILADAMARLGKTAHVLPNGFDAKTESQSAKLLRRRAVGETVRIGYASGTLTHQRDFAVASRAIARILTDNPNTRLTIVGRINIDEFPELGSLHQQIELRPLVPFDELQSELARFDINLAPLEVGNPYCEAKSDLKYYEAALGGVPTIASPTQPYCLAIRSGENGILATDEEDWYRALAKLVGNVTARHTMGSKAREHATSRYGPDARRHQVERLFSQLLEAKRAAEGKSVPGQSVVIVLPPMARGSGGHAKAISVGKALAHRGHSVVINFIGSSTDYTSPKEIEQEFGLDGRSACAAFSDDVICDANIAFATYWTTVFTIERSPRRLSRRYHFLQDFEPFFFPMGSDYLRAMEALRRNFRKISYGPWIVSLLSKRHAIQARSIPFYIDKGIYRPTEDVAREGKTLVFFARPEMPRRCFDLGVLALTTFVNRYYDGEEIILFGSKHISQSHLPFRCVDAGILSPTELARMYSRATLGLAFSTTNPSMVAFEMMACGLPVLDLDIEGVEQIYAARENVFLAPPDPDEIAKKMRAILNDAPLCSHVAENGRRFVEQLPDERTAIGVLVDYLEADRRALD